MGSPWMVHIVTLQFISSIYLKMGPSCLVHIKHCNLYHLFYLFQMALLVDELLSSCFA